MIKFVSPAEQRRSMMRVIVQCPHCGHTLMNKKRKINNIPSIYLLGKIRTEKTETDFGIYFSAYFGDFNFESTIEITEGTQTEFYCPFCLKPLMKEKECDLCNAPMVSLQLEMGGMLQLCLEAFERNIKKELTDTPSSGMLQFCSRRACERHQMEFEDQSAELKEFYKLYYQYLRDPET